MITKWKILDPLHDNTTTFRFWCDDEETDLGLADYLIDLYVSKWNYNSKGIIKIQYNESEIYYEVITTLPFDTFTANNHFFDFKLVSKKKIKGVKKQSN